MQTKAKPGALWRALPGLTLALLLGPVAFGLAGTLLPAFGYLDPTQVWSPGFGPIGQMLDTPGLSQAAWLSLKTGVLSTLGALAITLLVVAGWHGTRAFGWLERALSPLLSVPHAAAAFGLAFLIAPSGWIARLTSPGITGWDRPPDLLILQDPGGWALIFGLIAKELPFLLLMMLAALPQVHPAERLRLVRTLGYGRVTGWFLAIAPGVYAQIRLPVYAVLAYGMSNVDVAMILGPGTPATLSVQILRWMSDPDLALRAPAAAAALLQLGLVVIALVGWRLGEIVARLVLAALVWRGTRGRGLINRGAQGAGVVFAGLSALAVLGGLLSHMIWSFAGRWRFPDAMPETLKTRTWARHGPEIIEVSALSLALALGVTLLALVLAIGCLESEHRRDRPLTQPGLWLLYLPLITPQIAFLPGLQIGLLHLGLGQGLWPVVAAHLVFVLPYVFLTLAGPWRAWEGRLGTVALAMGASANTVLLRLRLPMLLAPIFVALAVGMAVSLGQFLPTLLASGGRIDTLTTEALALASGGDRRAIGAWALALTVAAWAPFGLALLVPGVMWRNRRGMRGG